MITRSDGTKVRDMDRDPKELEGFTLQPDGVTFIQDFLPCKFRVMKQCATCPKSKLNKIIPTCTKKRIFKFLNCVGCSLRQG